MTNFLIKTLLKFVSYDVLVEIIAKGLAYILEFARKKASPEAWDKAKLTVKTIKTWTTLFDEVYEDDNLTEEEEKLIQDAIADCTAVESIYELLHKKALKKAAKKTTSKKGSTKKTTKKSEK